MDNTSKSAMKVHAIASGVVAILGFATYLATRTPLPLEDFWAPYATGANRMGALMLIFGFIWCALSLAHLFSHFFDLDRPMEGNEFAVSLVVIGILVCSLLATVPAQVTLSPNPQMQQDPEQARSLLAMTKNLRALVVTAILLSGVAMASVPIRRFIKH